MQDVNNEVKVSAVIEQDILGIKHIQTNLGNTYLVTPKTWADFKWEANTVYKQSSDGKSYERIGDASLANNLLEVALPGDVQPIPPQENQTAGAGSFVPIPRT